MDSNDHSSSGFPSVGASSAAAAADSAAEAGIDDNAVDTLDDGRPIGGRCSPIRDQDRFLPIANISKIMKRTIPETGKITKEAKECVQECVSEFISFVTSEASDRCQEEKRKTMNGEDILTAMQAVGLDNYIEPLKAYLMKYREANKLEAANDRSGGGGGGGSQGPAGGGGSGDGGDDASSGGGGGGGVGDQAVYIAFTT